METIWNLGDGVFMLEIFKKHVKIQKSLEVWGVTGLLVDIPDGRLPIRNRNARLLLGSAPSIRTLNGVKHLANSVIVYYNS